MQPPAFLSLLVGTLYVTGSTLALIPEGERSLGAATDWAEKHADNLPTDFATFAQHSAPYRRAMLRKFDSATKGTLWNSHFDSYISNHSELSPEKLVLIRETGKLATSSETDEDKVDDLRERIEEAFDREEAMALFGQVGDVGCDKDKEGDEGESGLSRRGKHTKCNCKIESYWTCNMAGGCLGVPPCIGYEPGCGFLQRYPCDGLC